MSIENHGLIIIGENFNTSRKIKATSPRVINEGGKVNLTYTNLDGLKSALDITDGFPDDPAELKRYMIPHITHALKNNDMDKKVSSAARATKRFVPLTRDTSNIHWEKNVPTAPIPQIPLYWINLKRSKTRGENMVQQLRKLQWKSVTRIEAVDGKVNGGAETHEEDKDNYNELSKLIHVDKISIKSLPCYGAFCSPSQLATLLSHLRALRQAWADGHEYALVAEDDVDFILYDESILLQMVKKLPKHWGSLQLYTGNADLLEMLFKEYPAMGFTSRNSLVHNPWSQACVLYNRKGIKKILDQFGYQYKYDLSSLPLIVMKQSKMEADRIIPWLGGTSAFISARPMVNVHLASSTIDKYHLKTLLADMTISAFAHRFRGKAWGVTTYGNTKEILKTASHLRALAHAYEAGLDRVIVADDGLLVDSINFRAIASVIDNAVCTSKNMANENKKCLSNGIVQLLAPNVTGGVYNQVGSADQNNTTVLPPNGVQFRPKNDYRYSIGATSLYAVVGRQALKAFSELWDEKTRTVTVQ